MALLEYENQMFLELFEEDGLVVLARGLGIERLMLNLLRTYNDAGNLVLVIGTFNQEEEYIVEQLKLENLKPLPKIVTAEYSNKERYNIYMEGGILFITTRILVVDMLVKKVPIDLITGIIVYKAHKIVESSQLAFIIRLYRMENKTGFIKAVSSSPNSFTRGFCQVQHVMKSLFVTKIFLWPRFHAVVNSTLEKNKPEVFELHISLTPAMQAIQLNLLDLMSVCINELKKINPTLDTDDLTVENALSKAFDKIVKFQLDPIWHQLSSKTKRLISDLKTLQTLLRNLTQYDCITFYNFVKSIRDSVSRDLHISDWLFLDAAECMFVNAKERVFGPESKKKKRKKELPIKDFKFEENPKWLALSEILAEIREEAKSEMESSVLVVVELSSTCEQLKDFLCCGSQTLLTKLYNKTFGSNLPDLSDSIDDSHAEFSSELMDISDNKVDPKNTESLEETENEDKAELNSLKSYDLQDNCSFPLVVFHSLQGSNNPFKFQRILHLTQPKYIIMYDADLGIVRQLEVYQALKPNFHLRVYFLIFKGSAEEQIYLTSLQREKNAFEFLIREKAQIVMPTDLNFTTEEDFTPANLTVDSRKSQRPATVSGEKRLVIVDAREFRSELPSLIHRRGINIEPLTIEVGDYILSPDMCVERKSLSDLIGSLNSGRLYSQSHAMCRLYKKPILLIEFDQNKSFSLQGKYYIGSDTSSHSVVSKLTLLTLHFPALRILWCPSPYATAEMFEILKVKRQQPDVKQTLALKTEDINEESSEKYTPLSQEFVSKLPGVNSHNVWAILNKIESIADLLSFTEEALSDILGNSSSAKSLWTGIHKSMQGEVKTGKAVKKTLKHKF